MSQLTWNEIRTRAAQFAGRWEDAAQENAESQTFWNEFLQVYGIDRRRVAAFERRVDGLATGSGRGRVDLLWPGLFLAEHKTRGRDLEAATVQALDYVAALEEHERPQFVAVSDFERVRLHEVATGRAEEFPLIRLPQMVERFGFLIGRQLRHQQPSDPVNVAAAQRMGELHDLLKEAGYEGHALELLLVRLLFLLFGDDTGLWDEQGLFYDVLADHTRSDAQDLGATLGRLFQVLDTPRERRQAGLPDWLNVFPYVNGELFSERIDLAEFSPQMRRMLLDACRLDWGQVSPAIFGSMFQAAMKPAQRRDLGAHYTSEENILKALGPLFLDDLKARREAARGDRRRLQQFLDLLPRLRFLDPACGSGNFLLLAYRELRRLEISALVELMNGRQVLDIEQLLRVNVAQFYGIEFDEFPSQIARVALWLAEHQMNIEASRQLGRNFVNLPLRQSAHIRYGDALEVDWPQHLELERDADELSAVYVVGNPPFIGSSLVTPAQRQQIVRVFEGAQDAGKLDYVAAWYLKAARLLNRVRRDHSDLRAAAALVSTNSICQGEQVAPLWNAMLRDQRQVITAAHTTFRWSNEAPGVAAVHCIIVQFEPTDTAGKGPRRLFTYSNPKGDPIEQPARFINAYLADGPDIIVTKRRQPFLPDVQRMVYGNKPVDGSRERRSKGAPDGNLIISSQVELDTLLATDPGAAKFIKPLIGADEFLHGGPRWVLWLSEAEPRELAELPRVRERLQRVRAFREASKKEQTQQWAARPAEFVENRHPQGRYVVIPAHTSENRDYVPFGFYDSGTIVTNAVFMLPDADLWTFGLISSAAHMAWLHAAGGKLESRYRYSSELVYNTMPWPDRSALKPAQVQAVTRAAEEVLAAREAHPGHTLAQLYDPLLMPNDLRAAHRKLDRAVDVLYGIKAGATEAQRLAVLLAEYQQLVGTLESQTRPARRTRRAAAD